MKPSINLRYKSLLLICLLILATGVVVPAWGQYTIIPSTQEKVTERVDTVYVKDGVARELFVPELRNNDGHDGNDPRYKWYVRWYRKGKSLNNVITKTDVTITSENLVKGGTAETKKHTASLVPTSDETSLFWCSAFYSANSTATGASTVTYLADKVAEDVVICDVSLNSSEFPTQSNTIKEPTISIRYKFIIRPASVIAERISALLGEPLIKDNIWTAGTGSNINVQLGMTANNYAWDPGSGIVVGDHYRYTINEVVKPDLKSWEQIIDSLSVTSETTLKVWAVSSDNTVSPLLYQYTLSPISGSGFMLEDTMLVRQGNSQLDVMREPDKHKDLYEMIGYINFDRGDSITLEDLKADRSKNMVIPEWPSGETPNGRWLDPEVTGYAPYNYNTQKANVLNRLTTLQNQYGLFRTANLEGVSKDGQASFVSGLNNYWFIAKQPDPSYTASTVYDRTYFNTDHQKLGYFFFVDAANLPGRLVKIKLDGTMCAHTGILVNFWVNDMTTRANETHSGSRGGKPLPPNININFIGRDNQGNDVVLHRFTSGDALTYYSLKAPYKSGNYTYETNEYIGKWQQLMYAFTLSESLTDYNEFYLEVQNNTIHSYGADYAIDGLRVYRTKPQIDVKRVDACSSAQLTVSTDYDLLLRNMGWSLNPDVLAGLNMGNEITVESKHLWKYRYGLLGNDAKANVQDNYVGNVYFGFAKDMQNSVSSDRDAWITLNRDLLEYDNVSYNSRSKLYRIVVPTTEKAREDRFNGITDPDKAKALQIEWNLRLINNFYHDAMNGIWNTEITKNALQRSAGEGFPTEEAYLNYLEAGLKKHSSSYDNYVITISSDKVKEIMEGVGGLDESYEQLVRAVCSVLGMTRLRVPWWEEENGELTGKVDLSVIDVNKTDLKYKGERNFATEEAAATGEYDVVIFSARTTTDTSEKIDFPNASVDFKDPCVLSSPFIVLPSFTVVAHTQSGLPEGTIACEGRISAIDEATVWVEKLDEFNNPTGEMSEYKNTAPFSSYQYTFDWFLGDSLELEEFYNTYRVSLVGILKEYRSTLPEDKAMQAFPANNLINYCKEKSEYSDEKLIKELHTLLFGDIDTEPKLVIGGLYGQAEFRWVEWVVVIPYMPSNISEEDKREWLFCDQPQVRRLEAAPAPKLLVGFPDVVYPEGMEHYPNVPLRIGLPNIMEGAITDIPIQSKGLTMGMKTSNQLGLPNGNATAIFLRQGSTYTEVGNLTKLSAKPQSKNDTTGEIDNGGGLFSMTFNDNAYQQFNEGQTYALYIPFGEYDGENFVEGSCEGYATLLVKIVPEYLTWQGKNTGEDAEAWYNDENWKQSTKGELYIDQTGESDEDANGSDDVTAAAFAPLHFTRITIPGGQTLELEDLKTKDHLLQIPEANSSKATEYIQYDMAVDKDGNNTIVTPYYINKVKAIYFKPEAQLRRQQFLTYDTARVEFEMTPDEKYWMASPLQSVFAGDMYTVKNTGRQNTYAFADITYSTANNNRQAPAFYQKAWDKAITMYVPNSEVDPVDPDPSKVPSPIYPEGELSGKNYEVVRSNWSREYNDVNVPYALGKGFYASVEAKNAKDLNGNVLVRLPKADKSYSYEPLTKTAPTLANRTNSGKLADKEKIKVVLADSDEKDSWWNDETVIADGDGTHFLLGNPYMYPLDIAKFLKANNSVLAEKYWTLNTNGEGLVVGTPDVAWENGDITGATSGAVIAPMQAFFVELKGTEDATQTKAEGTTTDADLKTVHFDSSMMQGEPEKVSSSLRTATAKNPVLRLTAEREAYRSTALLTQRDDATNDYDADKDAVILLDTELKEIPQVYTIAGTRAVGVNVARRIDQIPLGVYAGEGKGEVTLTIEGIGDWAETLYLYDADTRKSVELTGDSYTLRLDGSSHGRYFLNAGSPTGNERIDDAESISIYSAVSGRVVASAGEALKRIQVFTPMGRLVRTLYPARPTYTFDLPAGIYIIRAEIAHDQKTVKLRVL